VGIKQGNHQRMELNKIFIRYRCPEQVIYFGDNTIDLFRINRGKPVKTGSIAGTVSRSGLPSGLRELLLNVPTGIILNSDHFVFNLLTFEKIPYFRKQRDELVNWRVEKIFPENIHNYIHQSFQFTKNTILSVLVKRDLVRSMEEEVRSLGVNLTYFGNSTIGIINSLRKGDNRPDFFIEADGRTMLGVFFKDGFPVYIRKMRAGRGADTGDEIRRTVGYVEKNYNYRPVTCSVFSTDEGGDAVKSALKELDFRLIGQEREGMRFLPGIK